MGGLNCTVFAYGQTGTGKTYTMCGDVTDQLPLPDEAGIVPRVLHSLFARLDALPTSPGGNAAETSVKVSFIELYNEELRDLLAAEDNPKLKIVDGDAKRGNSASVHGMEEKYISSFHSGIKHLRQGGHKRQVAATKCNDLSSRSHTVFTITVHIKKTTESGEEYLTSGKLNLVDLAGSENIKSSGAENKRAVEAGLINKSLLTLGRVINALVDRSPHIPYRESKLTRLLQDSLGGRTKTCIIATLSPAKSNIDETLSTLNYAFRAKDIRNMPQINPMTSKKTHLRELTADIEKLKSELVITRQKNGVFLTQENYDEITNESESRRIQIKEQSERLETIEHNLRNKIAELHTVMEAIKSLKEDNETVRSNLESAKALLEETEKLLDTTKQELLEETYVSQQHEKTENKLATISRNLITTLDHTTADISGLQKKLRRRSDLHSSNKTNWFNSQKDVSQTTKLVEDRLHHFEQNQQHLVQQVQQRIGTFFEEEKSKYSQAKLLVAEKSQVFEISYNQVVQQASESKHEMNKVLDEIKDLRGDVKNKVGEGLKDLGKAAENISAGIMTELDAFGAQLHTSYAGLGRDFKFLFEELTTEIQSQREQIQLMQKQMSEANSKLSADTRDSIQSFEDLVEKENIARDQENKDLIAQIKGLVAAKARQQESRMQELAQLSTRFQSSSTAHSLVASTFAAGSEALVERSETFSNHINKSKDIIKTRFQTDFAVSTQHFNASFANFARLLMHTRRNLRRSLALFMRKPHVSLKSRYNTLILNYMRWTTLCHAFKSRIIVLMKHDPSHSHTSLLM
jgi:kinesin family protein 11